MINNLIIYAISIFFILFFFSKLGYSLNLVDLPNKRKMHSRPTTYIGGFAISIIFLIAFKIFNFSIKEINSIIAMSFLISIVGLIDDRYSLNIGGKLSLQIIPIIYLFFFENLFLTNIGNYNYFELNLGSFSIPFSLLSILFLINAFNYFDGLDGVLSFNFLTTLAILFFLLNDDNIRLLLFIISLPLIIFLLFNFSIFNFPKLFLGDSGSLLLGFIISFLLIYIANQKLSHPILLAWSVSIFVYEFIAINLIRLKNKKNIFKPGKDHLHHLLYLKTNSIFFTNFLICLINLIFFICGYYSFNLINSAFSLLLFIFLFILFFLFRASISKLKN